MPKAIKQILLIGAVFAIAMVFIIQFRPGTNVQTSGGPKCAAEVGGNCIDYNDYQTVHRLIVPSNADAEQLERLQLKRVVADGLIERWLLNEDAKRLGISVSDDAITRFIAKGYARLSLPVALEDLYTRNLGLVRPPDGPARSLPVLGREDQKFNYKLYERVVREMANKTPADFREFQRRETIAARMRALVRARVHVAESEVRTAFDRQEETAVVDYVKLERKWYEKWVLEGAEDGLSVWMTANEEEVDQAFASRKDTFTPECRVERHVLIRMKAATADKEQAKAEARAGIDKVEERLEAGESMADLAAELSDDVYSKLPDDELPCIGKGQRVKPFEEALFALEEGKRSEVIETTMGFYLIELKKIAKGDEAEKLGRQQVARELYLRKEAERLAAEGAKQILAAVRGGKSLADAVEAHIADVLPDDVKQAADEAAKKQAAKKDAKPAEDGGDDAKPEDGGDDAKPEDGGDDAKPEDGGDDGPAAEEDEPETALTDPKRPQVETSAPFRRIGMPFAGIAQSSVVASKLFELAKPGDLPDDLIKLIDGYAVAQLKEKQAASEEKWKEQREALVAGLRRQKQRDALVSYLDRLRSRYQGEITYHPSILKSDKAEPSSEPSAPAPPTPPPPPESPPAPPIE